MHTLPHQLECLSDAWLQEAEAFLRGEIERERPVAFSISEQLSNAPPPLGLPGDVAAWSATWDGSELTVARTATATADLIVEGEYQAALTAAQLVGITAPNAVEHVRREVVQQFGKDALRARGCLPGQHVEQLVARLHDHLGRRTVENPDLQHRATRQGVARNVAEVGARGLDGGIRARHGSCLAATVCGVGRSAARWPKAGCRSRCRRGRWCSSPRACGTGTATARNRGSGSPCTGTSTAEFCAASNRSGSTRRCCTATRRASARCSARTTGSTRCAALAAITSGPRTWRGCTPSPTSARPRCSPLLPAAPTAMGTMTMLRNPDHVTIAVADVAPAIEFFELLGFRKDHVATIDGGVPARYMGMPDMKAEHITLVLEASEPRFEIQLLEFDPVPGEDPGEHPTNLRRRGYNHLAFRVDDIEAATAHLTAHGVRMLSDEMDYIGRKLRLFEGPESITLELVQWVAAGEGGT